MATQQIIRPKPQSKSWEAIFPGEQLTEQKSALFVKKLLAVAVSSVTYLRAIFPEHAYGDKCLEDLNLKILKDESSCPGACQVIKWVKGCFDALDRKYLKTLVIGIYLDPNNPDTVLETYTFKFTYNNNGEVQIYRNGSKISSAESMEETKKATIRLLRTIVVLTGNLDSLPDNALMTMKLYYYDDVTPEDYEPPGFCATNSEEFMYTEEVTNIAVGEVSTNFHALKMRVKTSRRQFEYDDVPADVDVVAQEITNAGLDNQISCPSQTIQEVNGEPPQNKENCHEHIIDKTKQYAPVEVPSPEKAISNEENEFQVRCPCGCNEDDGLMIMCSNCNYWQHGICFLITEENKAPSHHICDVCSKLQDRKFDPTDPCLLNMSATAVQATCLWRRTLSACQEFKRIMAPQLARRLGIEVTVAQGLINRLEKEGFIVAKGKGKRLGKMVDKDKLINQGIPQYLKTPVALIKKLSETVAIGNESVHKYKENDLGSTSRDSEMVVEDYLVEETTKIDLHDKNLNKDMTVPNNEILATQRGKRKRVISKVDNAEFEISNSQETGRSRSKRKKASKSDRDIQL